MEREREPRQSGSGAGSLMHNVIAPLPHADLVTVSQSLVVSLGGPRVERSTWGWESRDYKPKAWLFCGLCVIASKTLLFSEPWFLPLKNRCEHGTYLKTCWWGCIKYCKAI